MHQAKKKDQTKVININAKTFEQNLGVNWMFSAKNNKLKNIKLLADYAFIKCFNRNGVLISINGKGAALFYRSDRKSIKKLSLDYCQLNLLN